ncbi:MAG: TolB family protein [Chloroflexi bacterium]|nr:TolB family protein [Chloroflexota bacterium]
MTRTTLPTIIPSPLPRSLEDAPIVFERYSHQTPQIFMVNYNGSNLWAVPGQPDYSLVPQVGADGKTLLFRAKTSDGTYQVFSTLLTSGTPTQLTHGNGNNREAALSPDGMLIAFVSDRDDAAGEIYLMNADGSNQRRLTDHPGQDDDPTWSPDGRYLAHESLDPAETKGDIYIYDLETGASTLLTRSAPTRYNLTPDWSPDGKWIAFDGHDKRAEAWAIYIIHQDGSGLRRVVGGDDMCDRPAWSPDSTMLAFATSRETGDREKSNIWRVNLDGRDLIQVTFGDYDFNPSW